MTPDDFSLGSGQVDSWDLHGVDFDKSAVSQAELLKEDLAQVSYGNLLLDVGWYPEFSADGSFAVMVVKDADWQHPLFLRRCATIKALITVVAEAAHVAEQ